MYTLKLINLTSQILKLGLSNKLISGKNMPTLLSKENYKNLSIHHFTLIEHSLTGFTANSDWKTNHFINSSFD